MWDSKLSASAPSATRTDEPLGLTVHEVPLSLPPGAVGADPALIRRGRLQMLLLFLVCAAPVIASYLTYYVFRPEGRRNYGDIIEPQRPLPAWVARGLDGTPVDLRSLKGQWLLLVVAPAGCDRACQDKLYLQRQLREALGKDKDRVDRVWLISDEGEVPPALLPALAQATVLRVPADVLSRWLEPAPGHALEDHFYLVDPLGNWMMRFPAGLDLASATKARRDLERLLRASASWDQPGRPAPAQH